MTELEKNGLIPEYSLEYNGAVYEPLEIKYGKSRIEAVFDIGVIVDEFTFGDGRIILDRSWSLAVPGIWSLSAVFRIESSDYELFVPSVLYRKNDKGIGKYPRGGTDAGWSFMEDRTPLPSCVQLYNEHRSLIFCSEPSGSYKHMSSVSASRREKELTVVFRFPGKEYPSSYTGKTRLDPSPESDSPEGISLGNTEVPFSFSRRFFIASRHIEGEGPFNSYRRFLEFLEDKWDHTQDLERLAEWNEYYELKLSHLLSLIEKDDFTGNSFIKMGSDNGELQDIYDFTAGSFLVKSIEGAWVLAKSADSLNPDEPLPDTAESIGRFFLQGEQSPGIHQDCYDIKRDIWGGYLGISENDEYRYLINARCNGETMRSYLLLYRELLTLGREVGEFLELPLRVASFYLSCQLSGEKEGSFGRWWSLEGEPVNTLGTNGAYIVSFLIEIEPFFKDKDLISTGINRAAEYYAGLVRDGDYYGDTLDADGYDKESGVVLLGMFLDLYERDNNIRWLESAERAAEYVLTWVWQYNENFTEETPLSRHNFQTLGMTSVSVAHHHQDFYGISIAYDFFRLWEHTGEEIFRINGLRMMNACRQLISRKGFPLGNGLDLPGWQPEQINHTSWDYFNRKDRSRGHFDICVAWVQVLGLGAFIRIRERFPEFLAGGNNGF